MDSALEDETKIEKLEQRNKITATPPKDLPREWRTQKDLSLDNCRNMPFCGRARRGSRVRFPKEENARSRHQRLFVENVGKIEGNRS